MLQYKFNGSDSVTIQESQNAFNINKIESELAYIATHFKILVQTIKALESSDETLVKNLERLSVIRGSFRNARGVIAKAYIKLKAALAKNPGFSVLYEISPVLNGSGTNDCTIAVEKLPQYKYPPVTIWDVDRSFSRHKNILSDRRQKI
ncbi:hypothetical protein QE152_g29334 [Popillia japonica]|uniref:Uncharacterized protein n=1 Tax=Popillia japonica TaxID=7064 RepID=A0AAW1JI52_POPJA